MKQATVTIVTVSRALDIKLLSTDLVDERIDTL